MKKLIKAVKWEVKVIGKERSIQLFDENDNKVEGFNAFWEGDFSCSYNKLTSLEGAPKIVGGDFSCYNNKLTSLEGSPKEVGGNFYCYNNHLTSLEGSPKEVGGSFYCHNNKLTSLESSPKEVGGYFSCYSNQLTSLKGSPKEVGGYFSCYSNQLTSLEYVPVRGKRTEVLSRITSSLLKRNLLFADGIMSKVLNKRGNVYKVMKYGSKKESWAVTDGVHWSHGETLKQARQDLIFKITDRNTEEFKDWKLSVKREVKELIQAYRAITGACEFGTRDFCKNIDMSKKYSVTDVIKMTTGRYGNEEFKRFFGK